MSSNDPQGWFFATAKREEQPVDEVILSTDDYRDMLERSKSLNPPELAHYLPGVRVTPSPHLPRGEEIWRYQGSIVATVSGGKLTYLKQPTTPPVSLPDPAQAPEIEDPSKGSPVLDLLRRLFWMKKG